MCHVEKGCIGHGRACLLILSDCDVLFQRFNPELKGHRRFEPDGIGKNVPRGNCKVTSAGEVSCDCDRLYDICDIICTVLRRPSCQVKGRQHVSR